MRAVDALSGALSGLLFGIVTVVAPATAETALQGDPCGVLWRMGETGALAQVLDDDSLTELLARNRGSDCSDALNAIFEDAGLDRLPNASELSVLTDPQATDLRNLSLETLGPMRDLLLWDRVIDMTPDGVVIGSDNPFMQSPPGGFGYTQAFPTIPFSDIVIMQAPDGGLYPILPGVSITEMALVTRSDTGQSLSPDFALRGLRASRLFAPMQDLEIGDYAGVGVVAFPRAPDGSLSERATLLCEAFSQAMNTVQIETGHSFELGQQVATIWPVEPTAETTGTGDDGVSDAGPGMSSMADGSVGEATAEPPPDIPCKEAIARYDWREGSDALQQAADYYRSRGKPDVAGRVGAPDQDGPWLLAWAPGENKGSSADDVLVLAYDLSDIETQQQAERVFQSWRITIERNADLWLVPQVANEHWTSAFVRFLNMLGDNTDFYTWMIKG